MLTGLDRLLKHGTNASLSVIFSDKSQLLSELSVQLTMMSVCLCFVDVSVSLLMKTFNQLSVCLAFLISSFAVTKQLWFILLLS